ncbi:MAG: hypothetical protein FMNOHCHN_00349 [Ignavibacteriaceae bacterium]|nr:hypothetical protein [Ignavibacteriaceae bacterium]
MSKIAFIRNDDVREQLDNELINIHFLLRRKKIPLSLAVEPANVTQDVVNWINSMNDECDLLEVIQHGFDHNKRNIYPYGFEFGGQRDFIDQKADLQSGWNLLDKYFGELWTKVISFPYGAYNVQTLEAVNSCGYKAISTSFGVEFYHTLKDIVGRVVGKSRVAGKKISYHDRFVMNYNFYDFGTCINIIKHQTGPNECEHYSFDELKSFVLKASRRTNKIGVLLHHRFHKGQDELIDELTDFLLENDYTFMRFSELISARDSQQDE